MTGLSAPTDAAALKDYPREPPMTALQLVRPLPCRALRWRSPR